MRVEIKVFAEIKEPYAVIYTNAITGEVMKIRSILEIQEPIVTVADGERIIVLTPEETYMIRTENEDVVVYNKDRRYISDKRLYEMEALLGNGFLRISKSTIINLRMIDYVEPAFNGMMMILLKNGSKDFISRKYLPQLKKYLGI